MKILNYLQAHFFVMIVLLGGCSKDEPAQKTLNISNKEITISAPTGSSATVDIEANTYWQISNSQLWLTVNPLSGANNAKVTITANENPSVDSRTAELIISGTGFASVKINVTQEGINNFYEAFGGPIPGKDEAILFAKELIGKVTTSARVVTIAPDSSELFFMSTVNHKIYNSKYVNKAWSKPQLANFILNDNSFEPSISPSGKELFFVTAKESSNFDSDIWMARKENNQWTEPVMLSDMINTNEQEWHPSVSSNGDLYFAAARASGYGNSDIYFSKYENGEYTQNVNLGSVINTASYEWDPYVDPKGNFIIFKSNRPGGYGGFDMYITIKKDGNWSAPVNLGPKINTSIDDDAGDITPDGRFLIFARGPQNSLNIYWINADVLDSFLE